MSGRDPEASVDAHAQLGFGLCSSLRFVQGGTGKRYADRRTSHRLCRVVVRGESMKFRILAGLVALALPFSAPSGAWAQEKVLRAVMHADVRVIDPVWTTQ